MEYTDAKFGPNHRIMFYQGRRYVLFNGKTYRSFRVFPSTRSNAFHREEYAK